MPLSKLNINVSDVYGEYENRTKEYSLENLQYSDLLQKITSWYEVNFRKIHKSLIICIDLDILINETIYAEFNFDNLFSNLADAIKHLNNKLNISYFEDEIRFSINRENLETYDCIEQSSFDNIYLFKLNETPIMEIYSNGSFLNNIAVPGKKPISELDNVISSYASNLNYNRLEKELFFEPKTTFLHHYPDVKKNDDYQKNYKHVLRNKPEQYMHHSLAKYLGQELEGNILNQTTQPNGDRFDIEICVDVNCNYLLEVKWLGTSVKQSRSCEFNTDDPHTTYDIKNMPSHINQLFRYIHNSATHEKKYFKRANLVYFDARLSKDDRPINKEFCENNIEEDYKEHLDLFETPYYIELDNN
jgi:hypothetical protein